MRGYRLALRDNGDKVRELVVGRGVRGPQPVLEVKPRYTQEAMKRKAQGAVLMQALVGDDGSVVGTSVVRSLDSDLDRQAALAARQWKFKPGTRDGRPVPLIVTIELMFTLK